MFSNTSRQCPPGAREYTIKPGDTFYDLAQEYGLTAKEIMEVNQTLNPNQLVVGQEICLPTRQKNWIEFSSDKYQVRFKYPAGWEKVPSGPYEPVRYEGADGYFELSAIALNPNNSEQVPLPEEICREYAYGQFNPYGSQPSIQKTKIYGQKGCYIIPSEDQPPAMNDQAAFILQYPDIIYIAGKPYSYFLLKANKQFIKNIGETVEFPGG